MSAPRRAQFGDALVRVTESPQRLIVVLSFASISGTC
jgi:hypothetical protein